MNCKTLYRGSITRKSLIDASPVALMAFARYLFNDRENLGILDEDLPALFVYSSCRALALSLYDISLRYSLDHLVVIKQYSRDGHRYTSYIVSVVRKYRKEII